MCRSGSEAIRPTTTSCRRGRPEASHVSQQHPLASRPVVDQRPDARALPQPGLWADEAAAPGLQQLWPVRRQAGSVRLSVVVGRARTRPVVEDRPADIDTLVDYLGVSVDPELLE